MPDDPFRTVLLTPAQLAKRWQVAKQQIYRLTRDGAIPAVKIGRYYRYTVEAIERFERRAMAEAGTIGPARG
jgi:excisionase family DNA binding protein